MSKNFKRPSGNCPLCGTWRRALHQDHITPKWKGGTDAPVNLQYICANCHQDKTREDKKGCRSSLGRVTPPEVRAKISATLAGRKLKLAHVQGISAGMQKHWANPEQYTKHRTSIIGGWETRRTNRRDHVSQPLLRKLSPEQVREIRIQRWNYSTRTLAKMNGIAQSTLRNLLAGRSYRDVT